MICPVCKLGIDFIGNDKKVVLDSHLRNRSQIFFRHYGTRRIIRERKYKDLRPVCDLFLQVFSGEFKFILLMKRNDNRHPVRQHGTRQIRNITWLWNQHLISRI